MSVLLLDKNNEQNSKFASKNSTSLLNNTQEILDSYGFRLKEVAYKTFVQNSDSQQNSVVIESNLVSTNFKDSSVSKENFEYISLYKDALYKLNNDTSKQELSTLTKGSITSDVQNFVKDPQMTDVNLIIAQTEYIYQIFYKLHIQAKLYPQLNNELLEAKDILRKYINKLEKFCILNDDDYFVDFIETCRIKLDRLLTMQYKDIENCFGKNSKTHQDICIIKQAFINSDNFNDQYEEKKVKTTNASDQYEEKKLKTTNLRMLNKNSYNKKYEGIDQNNLYNTFDDYRDGDLMNKHKEIEIKLVPGIGLSSGKKKIINTENKTDTVEEVLRRTTKSREKKPQLSDRQDYYSQKHNNTSNFDPTSESWFESQANNTSKSRNDQKKVSNSIEYENNTKKSNKKQNYQPDYITDNLSSPIRNFNRVPDSDGKNTNKSHNLSKKSPERKYNTVLDSKNETHYNLNGQKSATHKNKKETNYNLTEQKSATNKSKNETHYNTNEQKSATNKSKDYNYEWNYNSKTTSPSKNKNSVTNNQKNTIENESATLNHTNYNKNHLNAFTEKQKKQDELETNQTSEYEYYKTSVSSYNNRNSPLKNKVLKETYDSSLKTQNNRKTHNIERERFDYSKYEKNNQHFSTENIEKIYDHQNNYISNKNKTQIDINTTNEHTKDQLSDISDEISLILIPPSKKKPSSQSNLNKEKHQLTSRTNTDYVIPTYENNNTVTENKNAFKKNNDKSYTKLERAKPKPQLDKLKVNKLTTGSNNYLDKHCSTKYENTKERDFIHYNKNQTTRHEPTKGKDFIKLNRKKVVSAKKNTVETSFNKTTGQNQKKTNTKYQGINKDYGNKTIEHTVDEGSYQNEIKSTGVSRDIRLSLPLNKLHQLEYQKCQTDRSYQLPPRIGASIEVDSQLERNKRVKEENICKLKIEFEEKKLELLRLQHQLENNDTLNGTGTALNTYRTQDSINTALDSLIEEESSMQIIRRDLSKNKNLSKNFEFASQKHGRSNSNADSPIKIVDKQFNNTTENLTDQEINRLSFKIDAEEHKEEILNENLRNYKKRLEKNKYDSTKSRYNNYSIEKRVSNRLDLLEKELKEKSIKSISHRSIKRKQTDRTISTISKDEDPNNQKWPLTLMELKNKNLTKKVEQTNNRRANYEEKTLAEIYRQKSNRSVKNMKREVNIMEASDQLEVFHDKESIKDLSRKKSNMGKNYGVNNCSISSTEQFNRSLSSKRNNSAHNGNRNKLMGLLDGINLVSKDKRKFFGQEKKNHNTSNKKVNSSNNQENNTRRNTTEEKNTRKTSQFTTTNKYESTSTQRNQNYLTQNTKNTENITNKYESTNTQRNKNTTNTENVSNKYESTNTQRNQSKNTENISNKFESSITPRNPNYLTQPNKNTENITNKYESITPRNPNYLTQPNKNTETITNKYESSSITPRNPNYLTQPNKSTDTTKTPKEKFDESSNKNKKDYETLKNTKNIDINVNQKGSPKNQTGHKNDTFELDKNTKNDYRNTNKLDQEKSNQQNNLNIKKNNEQDKSNTKPNTTDLENNLKSIKYDRPEQIIQQEFDKALQEFAIDKQSISENTGMNQNKKFTESSNKNNQQTEKNYDNKRNQSEFNQNERSQNTLNVDVDNKWEKRLDRVYGEGPYNESPRLKLDPLKDSYKNNYSYNVDVDNKWEQRLDRVYGEGPYNESPRIKIDPLKDSYKNNYSSSTKDNTKIDTGENESNKYNKNDENRNHDGKNINIIRPPDRTSGEILIEENFDDSQNNFGDYGNKNPNNNRGDAYRNLKDNAPSDVINEDSKENSPSYIESPGSRSKEQRNTYSYEISINKDSDKQSPESNEKNSSEDSTKNGKYQGGGNGRGSAYHGGGGSGSYNDRHRHRAGGERGREYESGDGSGSSNNGRNGSGSGFNNGFLKKPTQTVSTVNDPFSSNSNSPVNPRFNDGDEPQLKRDKSNKSVRFDDSPINPIKGILKNNSKNNEHNGSYTENQNIYMDESYDDTYITHKLKDMGKDRKYFNIDGKNNLTKIDDNKNRLSPNNIKDEKNKSNNVSYDLTPDDSDNEYNNNKNTDDFYKKNKGKKEFNNENLHQSFNIKSIKRAQSEYYDATTINQQYDIGNYMVMAEEQDRIKLTSLQNNNTLILNLEDKHAVKTTLEGLNEHHSKWITLSSITNQKEVKENTLGISTVFMSKKQEVSNMKVSIFQ